MDKGLWRIQRGLLARYGFEGTKRSGPLSGNEALALQWVKSIAQLARASQEWELQMEDAEKARAGGRTFGLDRFAALVAANNEHIAGEFTDELQGLLKEIEGVDGDLFASLELDKLLEEAGTRGRRWRG